jgi:hypothetical protein
MIPSPQSAKMPTCVEPATRNVLDRPLSLRWRILLIGLCAFVPTLYVAVQYHQRPDLTRLIRFGHDFQAEELPEIKALHPLVVDGTGMDGQYYAQVAIDPTLRRPEQRLAVGSITFRGQRIFLPALAYVLGLGQPRAIIFIYALLNLVFWFALLALVVVRLPTRTPRSFLILFAVMLTLGVLESIRFALTDLPCATLGFLALGLPEIPAAFFIALSILTKPTEACFCSRPLQTLLRPSGAGW